MAANFAAKNIQKSPQKGLPGCTDYWAYLSVFMKTMKLSDYPK
jgi:hypothetical protein